MFFQNHQDSTVLRFESIHISFNGPSSEKNLAFCGFGRPYTSQSPESKLVNLASFHYHSFIMNYMYSDGYLSLECKDAIEVPTRSPRRPRAILMDLGELELSFSSFKGSLPDAEDDVSSAEYKLSGPDSPRESIFSNSSSILPKDEADTIDLDDLLEEMTLDEFVNAEICTITDVVAYKYTSYKTPVHLVST